MVFLYLALICVVYLGGRSSSKGDQSTMGDCCEC